MNDIEITKNNDIYICSLKNTSIDFENVFKLQDSLTEIFNTTGTNKPAIIFNLEKLKSIDSSGIAFLMLIKNKIEEYSGNLILVKLNDIIKKTLSYTDLDKYFNVFETENKAIDYLKIRAKE